MNSFRIIGTANSPLCPINVPETLVWISLITFSGELAFKLPIMPTKQRRINEDFIRSPIMFPVKAKVIDNRQQTPRRFLAGHLPEALEPRE